MEIIRKNINMNHICGKERLQITLEDDFNVPDSKPDIYKRIADNGEVIVESLKAGEGKAQAAGKLKVSVLYQTDKGNGFLDCMDCEMDFGDTVSMPGLSSSDMVKCSAVLEDLTVNIINSRKISISAIISIEIYGENTYVSSAAEDIIDDNVYLLRKNINILALTENKRDILRIREQHELSSNKPNMGNILWAVPELRSVETKVTGDELQVKGEIYLFVMYAQEDADDNIQYLDEVLPFVGKVPLPGANEGMIADVGISASQKTVTIKPDYDGEPRVTEVEMVLDLDIKLYEEQTMSLVTDAYSTTKELTPVKNTAGYDELLIHNHSRCRMGDKFKMSGNKDKILQIINSSACLSIDDISVIEDGLMVEGAAKVNVLYISDNDNERIGCLTKEVPFSQKIEAEGIKADSFYTVKSTVEQLTTTMLGGDELEIRLVGGLDALVLMPMEVEVITEVTEQPIDYNMLRKLPGICGIIVSAGDTLWDIAKRHHTTADKIMETNGLASENVKPGTKLLIVKAAAL